MKPCDMPNYMLSVDCAGMNCRCSTHKTIHPKSIRPRIEVDLPDEQTVHQITKIKLLFHFFIISFSNVCRCLLTVLWKQQLIQLLEYLTSSELLQSRAKSFFIYNRCFKAKYLRQKVSCDVSIHLGKNIKSFMLYFVTETHKTLVLCKIPF